MIDSELASMLADIVAVESMVPWPCPSIFGPDPRYELTEVIGATRYSLVYLAKDLVLSEGEHDAWVAIKITRGMPVGSREALLGRRVTHEHVVRMLGRGEIEDSSYVVMEYVDGGTLGDIEVPVRAHEAVELVEGIARGIQALHNAGVYHLDLKPSNVLIDAAGRPKVTDFGLSVAEEEDGRAGSGGTISFMAPEQLRGEPGAPPADVHALGGLLYYLLTGTTPNGLVPRHARSRLEDSAAVDCSRIPGPLSHICRRALSPNPGERHPSAAHLAEELSNWRRRLPVASARQGWGDRGVLFVRRHPALVVAAASVLLLAAVAGAVAVRDQSLQLRSERRAHEMAQHELDLIKAQGREQVRRVAVMANLIPSMNPSDTVLPVLVWLEWLTAKTVVSDLGEIELAEQREPALESVLVQLEILHSGDSVAAALSRFALAQTLFELAKYDEVALTLDDLEARWPGERHEADSFWASADAMREASALLGAAGPGGAIAPGTLPRIDAIIADLRVRPDAKATHDLLVRVRETLGGPKG